MRASTSSRDGVVRAPHSDVLWGTVGSLMLELAAIDHEVVLGMVSLEDAYGADEAFLTSTTRGVVPIVQLDDHVIGDGTVGPITRELMAAWERAFSARGRGQHCLWREHAAARRHIVPRTGPAADRQHKSGAKMSAGH